jgi:hypothetical protein
VRLFIGTRLVVTRVVLLCAVFYVLCSSVEAQQPAKTAQIGYLSGAEALTTSNVLRELSAPCGTSAKEKEKILRSNSAMPTRKSIEFLN